MSNANNEKKPMQLEVTSFENFDKLATMSVEETAKLAKRINKLFHTAFVDYHGSVIHFVPGQGNVQPWQQFMVELHFKPVSVGTVPAGETRVRAFRPIEERKGDDILSGLKNIYGTMNSSERFQMTEEAAQILSEFMISGTNVDPWKPETYKQFKAEYQDQVLFGQSPVMIKITGLSLIALIRKIYGTKNESGQRVEYGIAPMGPVAAINNPMAQSTANWRVQIMQIVGDKTYELASSMGFVPAGNNGAVVVGF